jgi:hypothetical protein
MCSCDPVSGLWLYPSVERKAPSDHPDLCKRRCDATAARHGGPTSHHLVLSGINPALICSQKRGHTPCPRPIYLKQRDAQLNMKLLTWTILARTKTNSLPPCHLSAAQTVPVSIGAFDISFPGIYDSGFNKILDQKATLSPSEKKTNLSIEHRKVSETRIGVIQKQSKASMNCDTTILACIARMVSLKNQVYETTDNQTLQQYKQQF